MIDTIKLAVPVGQRHHRRLTAAAFAQNDSHWVKFHPAQAEISFRRIVGLANTDQVSFHRELKWDIPPDWHPKACLTMEFSIPKFWYGHNIHLLYDFLKALELLKSYLEHDAGLKGRSKLPPVAEWLVKRLDVCYAWRYPSQDVCDAYFDSLRLQRFPYKRKPVIHEDSILWPGSTYSVKLYKKYPEFMAHDRKELLKQGMSLPWIAHREALALGVLRFELTFRPKWLKQRGILTVDDLCVDGHHIVWDEETSEALFFDPLKSMIAVLYAQPNHGIDLRPELLEGKFVTLSSGDRLEAQAHEILIDGVNYYHPGGGFRLYQHGLLLEIVREMLNKYVGEGTMHTDIQVRQALLKLYKPNKVAHLTAFWMYAQRFGVLAAKDHYGKNPFYNARSDLKKAGIGLIERPDNVTYLNEDFWREARMKAPSLFVTNEYDDERDSGHVLNLPVQTG